MYLQKDFGIFFAYISHKSGFDIGVDPSFYLGGAEKRGEKNMNIKNIKHIKHKVACIKEYVFFFINRGIQNDSPWCLKNGPKTLKLKVCD